MCTGVPQVFDLWQDPQERYDIFMNSYTERTWMMVTISAAIKDLMKTYVQYPLCKLQSESYSGPITLSQYQRFQHIREMLAKEGFNIPLPTRGLKRRRRPRAPPGVASLHIGLICRNEWEPAGVKKRMAIPVNVFDFDFLVVEIAGAAIPCSRLISA
jgi:hypothetical protein